jgi:hypothetical protein
MPAEGTSAGIVMPGPVGVWRPLTAGSSVRRVEPGWIDEPGRVLRAHVSAEHTHVWPLLAQAGAGDRQAPALG